MKTTLSAWLRRKVALLTDFQNVMIALTVIIAVGLLSGDYLIKVFLRQDEAPKATEQQSGPASQAGSVRSVASDKQTGSPAVENSDRTPDVVSEKKTEAAELARARATEHPDSELTKPFTSGNWEAGISGLKKFADHIIGAEKKGISASALICEAVDPILQKQEGVASGRSWLITCRTGPYSTVMIRITEFGNAVTVSVSHVHEYGRSQGKKQYSADSVKNLTYHIALHRRNGTLDFERAEMHTIGMSTTEGPRPDEIDSAEAVKQLCRAVRIIEERSKIPPSSQ